MKKWIFAMLAICAMPCLSAEPDKHVVVGAKDTGELTDREYLMRKATLGSRAERVEALDVIQRYNDAEFLTFLLGRLQKEDDANLRIKIMHVLSAAGDVRAVLPMRKIARWNDTRVGVEAIVALYELGDDYYVPKLIQMMRADEENPEMSNIAYRALQRMTGETYSQTQRPWMNYYYTHRLIPYQEDSWYWPFNAPLPKTAEGSTKIMVRPKGKAPIPDHDVIMRHTHVSYTDLLKSDEP